MLDVTVITEEVNDGQALESQISATAAATSESMLTVTADAGYASASCPLGRLCLSPDWVNKS